MLYRPRERVLSFGAVADVLHLRCLCRRDRHLVAVVQRRYRTRRAFRDRYRVALIAVRDRVLVLRVLCTVVLPAAVRRFDLQFRRVLRDLQRTVDVRDLVVRRDVNIAVLHDRRARHVVFRTDFGDRTGDRYACDCVGALQSDRCSILPAVVRQRRAVVFLAVAVRRNRQRRFRNLERYVSACDKRHIQVRIVICGLRDVDRLIVVAYVRLGDRRRARVAELARVEQAVAAARRDRRLGRLRAAVVFLAVVRTVDRDRQSRLFDVQHDVAGCFGRLEIITRCFTGQRCRNNRRIGAGVRARRPDRVDRCVILRRGDRAADTCRQCVDIFSRYLIFNSIAIVCLQCSVIGFRRFGTFDFHFHICRPDCPQIVVADQRDGIDRRAHRADQDLSSYRVLHRSGFRTGLRVIPADQRITRPREGVAGECNRIGTDVVIPHIVVSAVVVQIRLILICGMVCDGRLRNRGVINRGQYNNQLAVNRVQQSFIIDHERFARKMEIALLIHPAGELLAGRRRRLTVQHHNAAILDVRFVVDERAGTVVQVIIHADVCIQTPLGGQMQNVVPVLIIRVIERTFVTQILGDRVCEIPRIAVRVDPADQCISGTRRVHHVAAVDRRAVRRPEVSALARIHGRIVCAEIEPYVVRDADPDRVDAQRLRRHGLFAPVDRVRRIVFIGAERPAAEGVARGVGRRQLLGSILRKGCLIELRCAVDLVIAIVELNGVRITRMVDIKRIGRILNLISS